MAFLKFADLAEKEIMPGFRARSVHSDHITVAYLTVEAGSVAPPHAHPHEQISSVTEGEFELTIDGVPKLLLAGDVAVIPSNVRHSARAVTDCKLTDVFYPVREDYRQR
jgi:quercetin dioxygenase-like cupin family protein